MKVVKGICLLVASGVLTYLTMGFGYALGTAEAAKKLIEYAQNNPDQTFEVFCKNV